MSLANGATLQHYSILGPLGAGAMGEVYHAKDTRLDREVAIKVLPSQFAADAERLKRFEREAKSLASLNHPNVAQIHGVDQDRGVHFLVLELVPGESLADRLLRGPLPVAEALDVCRQIADGLECAHEAGVIHRDLKPANVRLTPDGKVKVLDFGLAKSALPGNAADPELDSVLTTEAGRLIGTPTYMAPEQARGRPIDRRIDIWAFGCVLYECLAGKRAFAGETLSDVLAAVLEKEPDWTQLPAGVAAHVRRLLERCLTKDPRERLRDIGDARLELGAHAGAAASATAARRSTRSLIALVTVAALGGALATGLACWPRLASGPGVAPAGSPIRFQIPPPAGSLFNFSGRDAGPVAFSPDGKWLVFAATDPLGKKQLYLRALDRLAATPLAGTEGGTYPFWSPDSRDLGFFADGKLKRIAAAGGPVQVLADAPLGRGGAWNGAGEILFSPRSESGLLRVSASGGPVAPVTRFDPSSPVTSHRWPAFLPDGRRFLYVAFSAVLSGPDAGHAVMAGSLDSAEPRLIVRCNAKAEYTAQGFLLYTREQNLLAVRFDPDSLTTSGEPVILAENVRVYPNTASAIFSASQHGGIVFASGTSPPISQLVWFDRTGAKTEPVDVPVDCEDPRLSPDGRLIAVNRIDPQTGASNIYTFDGASASWSRLTFWPTFEHGTVWSPDGKRIAFDSMRKPPADIYVKAITGANETLVVEGEAGAVPTDWSADGEILLFQRSSTQTGWDLWTASPDGKRAPAPLLATTYNEEGGQLSPDGRWLAYTSDESGRSEVCVVAFPSLDGKWQVSDAGGSQPRWRRDGAELFYLAADRALMAVGIKTAAGFEKDKPERLFDTRARYTGYRAYDVAPDGQRFLINTVLAEGDSPPLTVVLGWPDALGR